MKVEVAVLMVFVDVKQHLKMKKKCRSNRADEELCESRGGRPDGLCGRKATFKDEEEMPVKQS